MLVAGDFPAILRTTDQTFFYSGTTVDFGDICLPGVSFWSFNHTSGLGPDDSVIFNILLSRVLLHPFQSFISGFNRWFAVFVAPDGIMFFSIWFAFGDAIICYFDENIRKLLNRILCTADTVSAEFQSCLMWECRPVSLRGKRGNNGHGGIPATSISLTYLMFTELG